MIYFQLSLCFLPLIIAVVVFRLAGKLKIRHQLLAVLAGFIAIFPISAIQYFITQFLSPNLTFLNSAPVLQALLRSIFVYGLIEESFKLLCLLPLPHKDFSPLKFLLLSFVLGISTGCFESAVYFFDSLQQNASVSAGAIVHPLYGKIILRIFTSDIIHTTCTGLCGIFLFSARNDKAKISALVFSILLHGFYDFFAGLPGALRYFSIVVVLLAIAECRIKYVSLKKIDESE